MHRAVAVMLTCIALACGPGPLPEPPSPHNDTRFPVKVRPACSDTVRRALAARDRSEIARAREAGADFTCYMDQSLLALDRAVLDGDPVLVRALLRAGADPNQRWGEGDRFPLQDALEMRAYGFSSPYREEIIALLLQHGADPNQRWCPFETRGQSDDRRIPPCNSSEGVTPLIMATLLDEPGATALLLAGRLLG